ncbi:hypothetical protein CYMTET_43068 [Cymbomonas tetramitiformis]|uniref:Uncharacterized protein n=1 Tax=Cymbomonas tetramitiformis TaxID=36881 RepID=A0AAE0F0X0_9CHLO|nr:hypothetical protein CYMTET_43068 [Cymbomonas tetramitiformis]
MVAGADILLGAHWLGEEKHTELRKITGIIKEEVWKTSHDVKVMEEAANGALGLQYGYMNAIKERLEELSVKAEVDLMDNLSMKNRIASYEEAIQVSHADNNTFTKARRRRRGGEQGSEAVHYGSGVGGGAGEAGGAEGGGAEEGREEEGEEGAWQCGAGGG